LDFGPLFRASCIEGRDCRCGWDVCIGGGGGLVSSDVRRESGGDMRPEECAEPDHPEYGGGGPFEYIEEVGLTTAMAAIVGAEV
jgi:hypothetical protein